MVARLALRARELSFFGYIALFRAVFVAAESRIGWKASYQITMAGLAATRLFAAAGAGGIALTVWACAAPGWRRGSSPRGWSPSWCCSTACTWRRWCSTASGCTWGCSRGPTPFAITIVPAIFGAVVITVFLACRCCRGTSSGSSARSDDGGGRAGGIARRLATVPDPPSRGIRTAIALVRSARTGAARGGRLVGIRHRDPVGVLPCVRLASPAKAVIVMAYFVGWIATRCRCQAASAASRAG